MTTLIFDWSDWDGPATGHVIVTRRTWRRAPESLHVPWQVVQPVNGRATLDAAHVAGEAVSIQWAPRGAASREDHVLVPDDGEHLAHLLERVDPSTLEPLPEDLPSAVDLVARAEAIVADIDAEGGLLRELAQQVTSEAAAALDGASSAATSARDAAELSQESALSVMPMLSGSVTITPQGGTLAVDLGQAVNVATGLAGDSAAVDVIFPPVTTPDGRVDPDGLGTLLRVDAGAERLTWPGGTVVHGTPPAGQPALASLVRVGGTVTVVWPPDRTTGTGAGATALVAGIEQIIGGDVEVMPGGTVVQDVRPAAYATPAAFMNPYAAPTSRELVLTVGTVTQSLSAGSDVIAYVTYRPDGLRDYTVQAAAQLGPEGEPLASQDGWLVAIAPPNAGERAREAMADIRSRLPGSATLDYLADGSLAVIFQYDAESPLYLVSVWRGMANLSYYEEGNATWRGDGVVRISGWALPMDADETGYAALGITMPGTFHRAAELAAMGVYLG